MKPKHFVTHLEHEKIVQAIRDIERKTTGQIHVYISHAAVPDPVAAARKRFERMGLHQHAHRNGILIFVAPRSQTFAVIGDEGVHEKVGDSAWAALVTGMAEHFKEDRHMDAIIFGIEQAGQMLVTNFPKPPLGSEDHKS